MQFELFIYVDEASDIENLQLTENEVD